MKKTNKENLLRALKEDRLLTYEELITRLERSVPAFVGKQVRYKVTDLPDRRTIRFYIGQGLIEKPVRCGRAALFSYRHLLQLTAVKYLQSQYFPLRKIAEVIENSTDRDLELILLEEGDEERYPIPNLPPTQEYMETKWRRFKLDDKLELHVEESFDISRVSKGFRGVSREISRILNSFGDKGAYAQIPQPSNDTSWLENTDLDFLNPASPIGDLSSAVVALITEGGLVPKGNPDSLEEVRSTRYLKYGLSGLEDLKEGEFESVDRGWDNTYVNLDPDRLLPLDVMREIEKERMILRIYEYFYTTTGVATSVDVCKDLGRGIAADLRQ